MPAPRALPLRTCFIPSSFLLLLGWGRDEPFSTLTAFHLPWVFKRQPFLSNGFFPSFFRSFYSIFLSPVSWVLKAFLVIDLPYTQFILSFLKLHPLYSTLFSPYLHLFHSIFLSPASWVLKPFSSLTIISLFYFTPILFSPSLILHLLHFLSFTLHPRYSPFLLHHTRGILPLSFSTCFIPSFSLPLLGRWSDSLFPPWRGGDAATPPRV